MNLLFGMVHTHCTYYRFYIGSDVVHRIRNVIKPVLIIEASNESVQLTPFKLISDDVNTLHRELLGESSICLS